MSPLLFRCHDEATNFTSYIQPFKKENIVLFPARRADMYKMENLGQELADHMFERTYHFHYVHLFDRSLLMPSLFHRSMLAYRSACSSPPLIDLLVEYAVPRTKLMKRAQNRGRDPTAHPRPQVQKGISLSLGHHF